MKQNQKRVIQKLNKIIVEYDILKEVASWIEFFGDDPNKITPERVAQHVKASLTGKVSKIRDKNGYLKALAICDEINELFKKRRIDAVKPLWVA